MKKIISLLLCGFFFLFVCFCTSIDAFKFNHSTTSTLTNNVDVVAGFEGVHQEYPPSMLPLNTQNVQSIHVIINEILKKQALQEEIRDDTSVETIQNLSGETRVIWFSYLDWECFLKNKNQEQFAQDLHMIFNNIISIGINTIIIHASAFQDAMYESTLMPISKAVRSSGDHVLNYDFFQMVIEEAQRQGVAVHAWINPMRAFTDSEFEDVSDVYRIKQWHESENRHDFMLQAEDGRWWLNPGNIEVRDYIGSVANEIVQKYDIDAIHIDDYFYPSSWDENQDIYFYEKTGSNLSVEDWRRDNTTQMVKQLYNQIKAANSQVKFGISPQANMGNNYNKMFIDVPLWLSEPGYIDYIMPQIYFGFENANLPFTTSADSWNNLIKVDSINLYIGLSAYKIGTEDAWAGEQGKEEWKNNTDILKKSVEFSRSLRFYDGFGIFSYGTVFDESGAKDIVSAEIENLKSILE